MKPSPCPTCGKEPSTKFWDYESDPSIYCCGATFEAYAAWERYVAAMELAQLEVEFGNCKADDEHKYQEMIEWARNDVLKVFK